MTEKQRAASKVRGLERWLDRYHSTIMIPVLAVLTLGLWFKSPDAGILHLSIMMLFPLGRPRLPKCAGRPARRLANGMGPWGPVPAA